MCQTRDRLQIVKSIRNMGRAPFLLYRIEICGQWTHRAFSSMCKKRDRLQTVKTKRKMGRAPFLLYRIVIYIVWTHRAFSSMLLKLPEGHHLLISSTQNVELFIWGDRPQQEEERSPRVRQQKGLYERI